MRAHSRYCGPQAIAAITGWTPDQVVLHLRALREQQGTRMGQAGTGEAEMLATLQRAGWQAHPIAGPFPPLRPYLRSTKRPGPTAWHLVLVPGHVFAARWGKVCSGGAQRPGTKVRKVWLVERGEGGVTP